MNFDSWLYWLMAPVSGASEHHLATWASWHGRLMVLAWAVLLPMGVMCARFFKVMPGQDWPRQVDNKAWWHAHRMLQYAGLAAMAGGLWLAWGSGSGATVAARAHKWLGLAVVALGVVQALGGWLRGSKGGPTDPLDMRGDHYDMTRHRIAFEVLHKGLGYLALLLAVATVVLGLSVADAPRWMWLGIGLWWVTWVAGFWALQKDGRCIDTYQAIWGPADRHPGNRIPPVGWGVRRYSGTISRSLFQRRR